MHIIQHYKKAQAGFGGGWWPFFVFAWKWWLWMKLVTIVFILQMTMLILGVLNVLIHEAPLWIAWSGLGAGLLAIGAFLYLAVRYGWERFKPEIFVAGVVVDMASRTGRNVPPQGNNMPLVYGPHNRWEADLGTVEVQTAWHDTRCGDHSQCAVHFDDANGSHGGAVHVHPCQKHTEEMFLNELREGSAT